MTNDLSNTAFRVLESNGLIEATICKCYISVENNFGKVG